jgi:hypothetical protein
MDNLVSEINTALKNEHENIGGPLQQVVLKDKILYVTDDSKNNELNSDYMVYLLIMNENDGTSIVGTTDRKGNMIEVEYSNQEISDCEEIPPEENECSIKKEVQGWSLNNTDFSDIEGLITYNGKKIIKNIHEDSLEKFINNLNTVLQQQHEKNGIRQYVIAYDEDSNSIYIVDSDINPVDFADVIEIRIMNVNDNSVILGDDEQIDGGYNDGSLYSNKELSNCD